MKKIVVTPAQLAAAFTEWERRYREDPTRFASESEVAALEAETYGDAASRYILTILAEQAA